MTGLIYFAIPIYHTIRREDLGPARAQLDQLLSDIP